MVLNMVKSIGKLIRWINDIIVRGDANMLNEFNLWSKGLSKAGKFGHYQEPITRQSYCASEATESSIAGTGIATCSLPKQCLLIGLPPRSRDQQIPDIMKEWVEKDMTAGDLIRELAAKLRVNKDKWVLIVVSNEKTPYVLGLREKVEKFINSKTERLYFYPEFVVRR